MGWSTNYCSLCGLPLNINKIYNFNDEKYYKLPKWIYTCTILFYNNNNLHNVNWSLKYEKYNPILTNNKTYGFIVIHCDCWKYIDKEKNIKLRYSDFPFVEKFYSHNNYNFFVFNINYNPIFNYQGQDFEYEKYINDGYSINSPLKENKILKKFIINIFNKLNIKSDRIGPRVSATLYKNNDLLIGSDNNIWKISNKKWIKATDIKTYTFSYIIVNKELLKNLDKYFSYYPLEYNKNIDTSSNLFKIPRLGEVSSCGFLIKSMKIKLNDKSSKIKFIIYYDDKNNNDLNKMIKNNFGLF
jgi:hypothetical protein